MVTELKTDLPEILISRGVLISWANLFVIPAIFKRESPRPRLDARLKTAGMTAGNSPVHWE